MKTVKVKPWGEGQGDHVLLNACDFDPAVHELVDQADEHLLAPPAGRVITSDEVDAARVELERMHAANVAERERLDVFAASLDAERIRLEKLAEELGIERERLEALAAAGGDKKEGDGEQLTATQLKEALTAKGIEFRGNASRADLQALLDAAA